MIRKKNKINISELSWPGCQNSYAVKRRANNNKRNHVYIYSPQASGTVNPIVGHFFVKNLKKKVFWGGSKLGFFVVFFLVSGLNVYALAWRSEIAAINA